MRWKGKRSDGSLFERCATLTAVLVGVVGLGLLAFGGWAGMATGFLLVGACVLWFAAAP
jgi:hypothetical protein